MTSLFAKAESVRKGLFKFMKMHQIWHKYSRMINFFDFFSGDPKFDH